jgi:N-acetylglucosaminyltransferase II (MGAT2)
MKPVVVFTAWDRVHYMERVLDSWRNVRGIEKALLIFSCEPFEPMAELVRTVDFAEAVVDVNEHHFGIEVNPYKAMLQGFATGADFVIQAEDDSIVASDVLEYMAWGAERYAADKSVQAICATRAGPPGDPAEVYRRAWFSPAVWGTWRDRWEQMEPGWPGVPLEDGGSWDWWIWSRCMQPYGKVTIEPCVTRSQHIGESGTHGEHSAHLQAEWGVQRFMAEIPPQEYREITRPE